MRVTPEIAIAMLLVNVPVFFAIWEEYHVP